MSRLNCKDFREKLFLYPEVDEEFYNHLSTCPLCKEEFENWIKIEERFRVPVFQEEIDLEWIKISKEIDRKITLERYKRAMFIVILTFIGSFLSLISFIFISHILNLPLILWGISILFKEVSKFLSSIAIMGIIFLAMKNEFDNAKLENGHS